MHELLEADMPICDGLPGVTHQRFLKAQNEAKAIFDPIVAALTSAKDCGET
jgi:hypothetical protein